MPVKSAGGQRAIVRQVCELIPSHLVPKLARKHGVQSRDITPSFREFLFTGRRLVQGKQAFKDRLVWKIGRPAVGGGDRRVKKRGRSYKI